MKILWQDDENGYRITVTSMVRYWIFEDDDWQDVTNSYRADWVKDSFILAKAHEVAA